MVPQNGAIFGPPGISLLSIHCDSHIKIRYHKNTIRFTGKYESRRQGFKSEQNIFDPRI